MRSNSRARNANRVVACILVGNEVVLRGDLHGRARRAPRPRSRRHPPARQHRGAVARLDRASATRRACRLHRRAHAALLGRRRGGGGRRLRHRQAAAPRGSAFPDKPIVIGEVGWPSDGAHARIGGGIDREPGAVPAAVPQSTRDSSGYVYLRDGGLRPAVEERRPRARSAPYWGVYDADRQQKFEFSAPIVRVPHWQVLAASSVIAAAILLWLFYFHSHTLRNRGRSFLAIVVYATATLLVTWILYDFSQQYLTVSSVLVGAVMLVGMTGSSRCCSPKAHEWAEAHWVTGARPDLRSRPSVADSPAAAGLGARAGIRRAARHADRRRWTRSPALDYPDFEVLVIDNNTAGRVAVAAGRGPLRRPWARDSASSTSTPLDGLQGGRAQLRAARSTDAATPRWSA
ncbi:MAG: hypothetical protein MZW92_78435 [Comamonadaceae bacterium]|nr:hypothetical protein [Comamonadaceae bacterium]